MLKLGQTVRWIGLGVEVASAVGFAQSSPSAVFAGARVQTLCLAGVGAGVLLLVAGHILMFVARERLRRAEALSRFER